MEPCWPLGAQGGCSGPPSLQQDQPASRVGLGRQPGWGRGQPHQRRREAAPSGPSGGGRVGASCPGRPGEHRAAGAQSGRE